MSFLGVFFLRVRLDPGFMRINVVFVLRALYRIEHHVARFAAALFVLISLLIRIDEMESTSHKSNLFIYVFPHCFFFVLLKNCIFWFDFLLDYVIWFKLCINKCVHAVSQG